jgi:hydrogenase nickel incorporation protein HypA/HybF
LRQGLKGSLLHELGIAQSIIDIALRVADRHGGGKIARITIQAGELRSIIKEQLQFCFSFAAKDTPAEGAQLEVEVIPLVALCEACRKEFRVQNLDFHCPDCMGNSTEILQGKELRVLDLELA